MSEHSYTRNIVSGKYDIDNPDRVDGGSKQIYLSTEVETALSGKDFTLCCNAGNANFKFDDELTAGEITTLDTTVSDHQSNA